LTGRQRSSERVSVPEPIPCQRHLFDLPADVAYLNCAYMSPLLKRAAEVGAAAIARKCQPWRIRAEDFFSESERARALFARLLGAGADDIALVPAASYGLAVAAANLPVGARRRILVLAEQFPSNVYTWRTLAAQSGAEVVTVARAADGDWTRAVLARLDQRVAITAVPHCHWIDGGLLDLAAIGARCRDVGSALVVDATQSLGALPLDLAAVRPDYLVCPGYKWLLGPYSLGYLYVAPARQDGRPLEQNWIARAGSEDFARLIDYQQLYQPGARRFDVGERSNFALLPVSIVGLEQLLAWGTGRIAATLAAMTMMIAERAAGLGLRAAPTHLRAGHYLGLRFPHGAPEGLPERLAAEQVHVSMRGDSLRVTPHLYNDDGDIERLFAVLEAVL
jgi:selenocysteine lyase/cysteine desulfurase